MWTCVGLSFIFLVLRLYVRISLSRRLFDDDYLVLLAWIILLTCTILWHVEKTLDLVYLSLHVGFGTDAPTPYYLEHFVSWLKILVGNQVSSCLETMLNP